MGWLLNSVHGLVFNPPSSKNTESPNEKQAQEAHTGPEGDRMFRMPLHYPRYRKEDYERMEGWKVDMLLQEYGLGSRAPWKKRGDLPSEHSFGLISFKRKYSRLYVQVLSAL
ncbi:hypothetical protein NMG60_11002109 [Bertholletia excelsa]